MCRLIFIFVTAAFVLISHPSCGIDAKLCSAPVEGSIVGSNLVSTIDNVPDELTCQQRCLEFFNCTVYTYHRANSTFFPETCHLLTHLKSPVKECLEDTCRTGLQDCSDPPICSYLLDGEMVNACLIPNDIGVRNVDLLQIGACPPPVAVAVGGGGRSVYGGGGSGYVSHCVLPSKPYMKLQGCNSIDILGTSPNLSLFLFGVLRYVPTCSALV